MNYNKLAELYNSSLSDEQIFNDIINHILMRNNIIYRDLYEPIKIASIPPDTRIIKKRIYRIKYYLNDIYNKNELKRDKLNDLLNFKIDSML